MDTQPARAHPSGDGQSLDEVSRTIQSYQSQLLRQGQNPRILAHLALAYLVRARLAGDWADVDRAEATLAQARSFTPDHPEVLWVQTQLDTYQHRFGAALEAARRMLQIVPADPRAWGAAGTALLEMGELEAARAHCEKRIELQRDFDALEELARVHSALGAPTRAVVLMEEALADSSTRIARRQSWAKASLAFYEMESGRLGRAEEILRTLLADAPEFYLGWKFLGDLYRRRGEANGAEYAYGKAFGLYPDPMYAVAWADANRCIGQTTMADTLDLVAQRALCNLVESGRTAYLRSLATFYLSHGIHPASALECAVRDTMLRKDVRAFEILAWAYQANGRLDDAWCTIQRAVVRPDAGSNTYRRAGLILKQRGRETEAEFFMAKARLR